jgi:hypothetical protein
LALAITCVSAAAFAQTTQQTAPSLTGGVPNPISPLRTQQNTTVPFGNAAPTQQAPTQQSAPSLTGGVPNPIQGVPNPIRGVPNAISPSEETGLPHVTPLGAATLQNPIGAPHPMGQVVPNSEAGD